MSDVIVYENEDWVAYRDRMEASDSSYTVHGYLAEKREGGGWDWPMHMAKKTWFKANAFIQRSSSCLKASNTSIDARLLITFYKIGQESMRERLFDQVARDSGAIDFQRMIDVDTEAQRRLGSENG